MVRVGSYAHSPRHWPLVATLTTGMVIKTIEARCEGRQEEAHALASDFGGCCASGPIHELEYRIVLFEDREELWDHTSRRRGFSLSFRSLDRRVGSGNLSRRQPLGRAIGQRATHVVDATAGLGHDACLLACMGWKVVAIEQDPFIATLLKLSVTDAHRAADLSATLSENLQVVCGDAAIELAKIPSPDVVYLDPMFEITRGSALPRKPAQLLQTLAPKPDCGSSHNTQTLFASATSAAHRVVVKRPRGGPPLKDDPALVFGGRLVRYDVYLSTPDQ
jgi:16S rRNA (guanine1516-N2)-methyltransferase